MKRAAFVLVGFLSLAGWVSAKTFPPVVVSADLENHGRGGDAEAKSPIHYALYVAPYEEFGNVGAGGQNPPSANTIADLVRAALPAGQYVPVASASESADVVIGVQWGELSPRGPQPFVGAREGGVVRPVWAILVGRTHVPPFMIGSERSDLEEEMRRDRYYLLISSYDAAALREGKVSIRWQTRTSVDSLQVGMADAWGYLAGVAQSNIAKTLDRPRFVSDPPKLTPAAETGPSVSLDDTIPRASKLMTFEKAMPPY